MLPIVLGVCFVVFIIAMAVVAVRAESLWLAIAAIVAAITATIFMAILFHSWLFVLWAGLLVLAIFLLSVFTGLLWKILLVICLIAIALGGFFITQPALKTIDFTNFNLISNVVEKVDKPVAIEECIEAVDTTPEPVVNTPEPVVSTPVPVVCIEAQVIESQTHGGRVLDDLNDGDPFDYSLTVVNHDLPQGTDSLVVLTEAGSIFDVIYPEMFFTSYRLQGSLDEVLCSVNKIAGENALAYVYVGKEASPVGWQTVSAKGWWTELVAKEYSEEAITPGGEWTAKQISPSDGYLTFPMQNLTYGQLWDPRMPGKVVHFQIDPAYIFVVPAMNQGTMWMVSGGDPDLLQERFIQASKEVVERDELSISNADVILFYCGKTAPENELVVGADTLKWSTDILSLNQQRYNVNVTQKQINETGFEGWRCEPKY